MMSPFLDVDQMVKIHHDTHVFLKERKSGWEELLVSARINKDRWPTDPHSLSVDLFKHSRFIEKEMIDYMDSGSWESAFGMAQDGYLTRHFLQSLISVRLQIVNRRLPDRPLGKKVARVLAQLPA